MKKNRSRKSSRGKLPLRTVPEDGLLPVEDVEGGEGHEEHQPEPHHQVHLHHVHCASSSTNPRIEDKGYRREGKGRRCSSGNGIVQFLGAVAIFHRMFGKKDDHPFHTIYPTTNLTK